MPLVRASGLDLFLACAGYLKLPAAPVVYENAAEGAAWGTMVHHWKETGKIVHENKRTANSFRKRLIENDIQREALWPLSRWPTGKELGGVSNNLLPPGYHEISVAYNWQYGYVIPYYGKDGDIWKSQFNTDWVTGTLDYLEPRVVDGEQMIIVDDLKTGKWWDKRPRQSAQIVFYAMCAGKLYNVPVMASVTHWPRYPVKTKPKRDAQRIDLVELDRFEAKLQMAAETAVYGEIELVPGEKQCRFCPARRNCPAAFDFGEVDND